MRYAKSMRTAFLAAILCLVFLSATTAAHLTGDPPAWELKYPPDTTTTPSGKQSTLIMEKREYVKEDGTKVSEERMTQIVSKDGKWEYTDVNTWSTEEKGEDKLKIRRREHSDDKGNKTIYELREVTHRTPEGLRTDYYTEENGKVYYTGYLIKRNMPPEKPKEEPVKEERKIAYDNKGEPQGMTDTSCYMDGSVKAGDFVWDAAKSAWSPAGQARSIIAGTPSLIAPSAGTAGSAIAGTVRGDHEDLLATSHVVALSGAGRQIKAEVGPDGTWHIPSGTLSAGIWQVFPVLYDGRVGERSDVYIYPEVTKEGKPEILNLPRLCFTGSSIWITGNHLCSDLSGLPKLIILSGDERIFLEPKVYSDEQTLIELPEGASRGIARIWMDNGRSLSEEHTAQLVSFVMETPESIKTGQNFLILFKVDGLSGEMLKTVFLVDVELTGPAVFVGSAERSIRIELKDGYAEVPARVVSEGRFFVSGRIVKISEP